MDEFKKQTATKERRNYATPPHPKDKKLNKVARARLNKFTKEFIEEQMLQKAPTKRKHKP